MSLEFRGEVQAMGINLESSAYVCISSTDEMTKDINLDTKEKRSILWSEHQCTQSPSWNKGHKGNEQVAK